ncbi:MAG: hypothetical protein HP494_13315 [Nitrospira sp.]|nr:hypothetical protein [Nitrospira sp.]
MTSANTLEEMLVDIDAITEQQVARVAQELFAPGTMAITGLGPLSSRQISAVKSIQ